MLKKQMNFENSFTQRLVDLEKKLVGASSNNQPELSRSLLLQSQLRNNGDTVENSSVASNSLVQLGQMMKDLEIFKGNLDKLETQVNLQKQSTQTSITEI